MMRKILSVAAMAGVMAFAGTASAGVTVDLLWNDTGSNTLGGVTAIAPDSVGDLSGCGINLVAQAGDRCMKVVWTTDEAVFIGSNSVGFDTGSGLQGRFASFFNNYNQIPVGKTNAFLGFPDPTVDVNNAAGTVGLFTGAVNAAPPGNGSVGLPAGTYTVGTIIWNTTGAAGSTNVASFINPLLDGFGSIEIDPASGENVVITDVVLGEAVVNVVPEPGTASLLGLGLVGLMVASRRRNG